MNKRQFATLSTAIKSAYPASKFLDDDESMDFWYTMLQDLDYRVAENAIAEHICTNTYPPNIAEIRKLCMSRTQKTVLSFDDAWGVVVKAMNQCGRDEPFKAYDMMDELTTSVVKNLGWYDICTSENIAATRANFREAYEQKAKIQQRNMQLPEFVIKNKLQIQGYYIPVVEKKEIPQIETSAPVDIRETLTDEQLAQRARRFEEARRKLFGKETE